MNLKSAHIIDTDPFPAVFNKLVNHDIDWINNTGKTIKIWMMQVWMGMDIGGRGDFWFRIERKSDDSPMGMTNWDHYAEPTGLHHVIYKYDPNWFEIAPLDGIHLQCGARRWLPFWPIIMRGHVSVLIYYTDE